MKLSDVDVFENIFVDNLLNFAGSPKGVLLLHESGSMERCVSALMTCTMILLCDCCELLLQLN